MLLLQLFLCNCNGTGVTYIPKTIDKWFNNQVSNTRATTIQCSITATIIPYLWFFLSSAVVWFNWRDNAPVRFNVLLHLSLRCDRLNLLCSCIWFPPLVTYTDTVHRTIATYLHSTPIALAEEDVEYVIMLITETPWYVKMQNQRRASAKEVGASWGRVLFIYVQLK